MCGWFCVLDHLRANVVDDDGDAKAVVALEDVLKEGCFTRSLVPYQSDDSLIITYKNTSYQKTREQCHWKRFGRHLGLFGSLGDLFALANLESVDHFV